MLSSSRKPLRAFIPLTIITLSLGFSWHPAKAIESHGTPTLSTFVEPQAGVQPVVSLIHGAKHFVRVELYELSDTDLIDSLVAAKRRHVLVQVMLEQHPDGAEEYANRAYSELKQDGIQVKWANEARFTYTHEKAMDVDNRVAGIFTFNWSYSAFSSNREFGVVDHNAREAAQIGAIFEDDWQRRSGTLRPGRLIVSPVNARSRLTSLIHGARHTLDLYEEEMSDGGMEAALIGAAKRHVAVRLVTSDESSGVKLLRSHGVRVGLLSSPYIHAKAIVADGRTTFIGSENMSSTSLDRNREMGIIVSGAAPAKVVESQFRRDWAAASR